ncbi:hypothetical protein [Speluncibacter jeojiensis]|uniref:hypothetical protein n=1 Tax=Speluncibacter jeojiensis TaxID=2710754 RepID=UPI002410AD87|nr:hypothetical protein [Rhodococcus sp. D2-41]
MLDETLEEAAMTTVELIEMPAHALVCLRGTVADYSAEGELWQRFLPSLAQQGIEATGPGGCIGHDGEFRESDVDESVFVTAPDASTSTSATRARCRRQTCGPRCTYRCADPRPAGRALRSRPAAGA